MQNYTRPSQVSANLERGALALIFCVGYFGYLMHTTNWLNAIPGDYSDARFNSVVLEHLFQWLRGEAVSLWSPAYFYPFTDVLGFSDNHFGSGWIYAIFRALGLEREYAYLGWFLFGNILNFSICAFVLRRLGFSLVAAAAGAFVYAFGLPALIQEAHAQLNYRFATPLAFYAFTRWVIEKSLQSLTLTIFWIAVQIYCSIYLGVFLLYLLSMTLIATLLIDAKALVRKPVSSQPCTTLVKMRCAFVILLSVAAIFLLLLKYRTISQMYGFGAADIETTYMLPRPSSYLLADRVEVSRWFGWRFAEAIPPSYRHEHQLFFGFGVWALALSGATIAWLRGSEQLGKVVCVSVALLIVLTLDISGNSLYWVLLKIPGLVAVRAVSRIGLTLLLPMAILVTLAIDYFVKSVWYPIRRYRLAFMVLSIVAITYETTYYQPYHYPLQAWRDRQIRLNQLITQSLQKGDILYVTQAASDPWDTVAETDAMIYAQDHGVPTLNGYSGRSPPRFRPNHPCISFESRLQSYFDFAQTSTADQHDYLKRVRVISPEGCSHPPAFVAKKQFDRASAGAVQLTATAEIVDRALGLNLTITNQSAEALHTISKEWPIRLSWRFVPLDARGIPREQPGWDARKDLYFSLETGQTHKEFLTIPVPDTRQAYALELSLVQEGYYWFHEAGMPVATVRLPI